MHLSVVHAACSQQYNRSSVFIAVDHRLRIIAVYPCCMQRSVYHAAIGAACDCRCTMQPLVLHATVGVPCSRRCCMQLSVYHAAIGAARIYLLPSVQHASVGVPCICRCSMCLSVQHASVDVAHICRCCTHLSMLHASFGSECRMQLSMQHATERDLGWLGQLVSSLECKFT